MKLESIELRDFRGISSLKLPIDERLTVIAGDNGLGKTSILDAISYSLHAFLSLWLDKPGQPKTHTPTVKSSDVALTKDNFAIEAHAYVESRRSGKQDVIFSFTVNAKKTTPVSIPYIMELSGAELKEQHTFSLFVYYRQNRAFDSNDHNDSHQNTVSESQMREQSLSADLRAIHELSVWWDKLDAQEARRHRDEQPGYRDPQLEAVRSLIREMEEFEAIGYDAKSERPGLYLQKTMGSKLHVDQLSSGERAYLILLSDLARRLQMIQPDAALADIPGVVLIDEIDLHLHPDWQRSIVPTLIRVFKSCQFIITTHSPQVLGEIRNGSILVLHKDEQGEIECRRSRPSFGRDSNDILIDVLGSTERDRDVKMELGRLESLISRRELGEARRVIAELRLKLGGRPVELEIAEQRLRRRERRAKE